MLVSLQFILLTNQELREQPAMLFIYIWSYQALPASDAQQKFSTLLTRQSDIYNKAWGHAPAIHTEHIGNTLIGQLSYDAAGLT